MSSHVTGLRSLRRTLNSGTGARVVTLLLAVAVVLAVVHLPEFRRLGNLGLIEFSELGALAPLFLILSYVVAAALLLPVFPLDVAAGAHFDFWLGVFWVQVAATTASIGGYFVGGLFFRRLLDRLMRWKPQLRQLDQAVAEEGWKIVFLTRLSPLLSFSLLSGFYGAIRVPFLPYLLATFFGMLPGTALYVYAGDLAGDLSGSPGNPGYAEWQWWVEVLGFAATAILIVYLTRRAQKILRSKLEVNRPEE